MNLSGVSKSYEFLDNVVISTDDFFYDLFDGGYIKVDKLLKHKEDIDEVKKAIKIIKNSKMMQRIMIY